MKKKLFFSLFFILDILAITASFIFVAWLKPGTRSHYLPTHIKPFLGFFVLWVVIALIGHKYKIPLKYKIKEAIASILKIDFTALAIATILIFFFKRFTYSRSIVFGTIVLTSLLECLFVIIFSILGKKNGFDDASTLSIKPNLILEKAKPKIIIPEFPVQQTKDSVQEDLKDIYLVDYKELYNYISKNVSLNRIIKQLTQVLNTHTIFNIKTFKTDSLQLFINLHKINDFRRLNEYFILVNNKLQNGGYFVGQVETIKERWDKFFNNLPGFMALPLYSVDFFAKRVFPKLPFFKKIYFLITKGSNRTISRAEVLGRLSFCGFQIISEQEINNRLHFIVRKIDKPKNDRNPSYGPLIKLRRIGKDRKIIYTYKVRTMHPYSEYLQDYVHETNALESGGKFKDDFRITGWGKLFRKMWIDELPQLLNFFRGELSLVGVRALSEHYFDLYPKEIQELRVKFKPGLVPPYYADMPGCFDDIMRSEETYLKAREKAPFKTQFKYFFTAMYNIFFKHARSK